MQKARSPLFRGRHYRDEVIVLCVRWYLRFSLSYRDVEELARERGFGVDHVTIWHWVQRYAPELDKRLRPHLKPTGRSWRVDETYVKVKGRWAYLYRAVDSTGQTIDFLLTAKRDLHAAKRFLQKALRAAGHPAPRVINVDRNPAYPAAVEQLQAEGSLRQRCRLRQCRYLNNRIEQDHRATKRRVKASGGFRSFPSAWRTIRGYEAVHMIRKGQARWVDRADAARQAQLVATLLGSNA